MSLNRGLPFLPTPIYHGVKLDRSLTFCHHLVALRKKLSSRVTLLRTLVALGWETDAKTFRTATISLVYSKGTWKLDFIKRHLKSNNHLYGVQKLRNKNPSLPAREILKMLSETPEERNRKRACKEEVVILIDNVLLALKMNNSLLSVQDINNHMAEYVRIPENWQSKNYAFEFFESINVVISQETMKEIASANFHTLTVDESTDISVSKYLILYFKYRVFFEYKTRFGGIIQLKLCEASSVVTAIEEFYEKYRLEMHKMVMFTSDGAAVMLGRRNGVAVKLKEHIPHLVQQHCVAHREDLGIADTWKEVKLLQDIATLMRTIYSMFSRSTTNRCKFQDIAASCKNEAIAFKLLNEVRWLSRYFALQAIIKNYDSLIAYFEEIKSNDPISKYCFKKLKNNGVHIALEVLNDVFEELTALCKIFQRQD